MNSRLSEGQRDSGDRDSRGEAVLGELLLDGGGQEEAEELFGGIALRRGFNEDGALLDGRVKIVGDDEVFAAGGESRREGRGKRDEAGVGVAGVDELRGLGNVFGGDQARLEALVEAELLEDG